MTEEQDEFFVEPEVQEVRNLQPISDQLEYATHQPKQTKEEAEHIHLKMIQIPKEEQFSHYRPFRFQRVEEDEESGDEEVKSNTNATVEEHYNKNTCVYQRFNNKDHNEVANQQYFAGLFVHRKIFSDAAFKESHEIVDILKQSPSKIEEDKHYTQQDLHFDSCFESGNLFAAYKVSSFQYDLMMSNDTNSLGGSNQWFYFSVANMLPNKHYTFSIINFTKSDSLFNYGMAPAVYSLCENRGGQNVQNGWKRAGKDVSYRKGKIHRQKSRKYYYVLTFTLSTSYERDKLFVAHSYPYTCEKLKNYLADKTNRYSQLVTRFAIGKTISKRPIECLMICHAINKKRDVRKAIIIMARQHPGETQGSFVCEGLVDRLFYRIKEMDFLLKNFVIYVIPMVNPDGVVFGHYRCNLMGKDLNRKWNVSEKDQNCPQVTSIKAFIQELSQQRQIKFILDLHGHSKKLNSFFYGNPCAQHPQNVRSFPFACSKLHQGIQYLDCTFATEECKKKAARVYLSFYHHLIYVYTFESSFYAYIHNNKTVQFTPKEYRKLGATLANVLSMQLQYQLHLKNNSKEATNSPFARMMGELRSSKQLMSCGTAQESGSQSKPEEGELNNVQLEGLKTGDRNESSSNIESHSKTVKITRRGIKGARDHNYNNRPIRNVRFLQISKINSVLPDRFQLALQPIKKKESLPESINSSAIFNEPPFEEKQGKYEVKLFELKGTEIESCNLSNAEKKKSSVTERRLSSLIQSMNNNRNNIIVKVDNPVPSFSRPARITQIHNRAVKNAFSQTMIAFNKEEGKVRSSQRLPAVESNEKQRYDLIWPKITQMNINNSMRVDIVKETETLLNGLVKKIVNEKESYREEMQRKRQNQKSMSLKRTEYLRK